MQSSQVINRRPPTANRYIEIDLLRTLALAAMILYHTLFDLAFLYGFDINVSDGGWKIFARVTAILFLLLVGMSAALSYARLEKLPKAAQWKRHLRRFMTIGAAAMAVTAGTYVLIPDDYVRFGILHLIAVSALLLPLFAPLKKYAAVAGIVCLMLGPIVESVFMSTPLLLPFGIRTLTYATVDHFPLFPWFGVILIGYALGMHQYAKRSENIAASLEPKTYNLETLAWPGRHSLLIYLLHQPIVLLILWLILGKPSF